MAVTKRRTRRSKEEARALILEAAETLLRKGGPAAVTMRAVAGNLGITDAAVSHHFGTRQELLEALLHQGGRRLKDELNAALKEWRETKPSIQSLVDVIADVYADGAYSELALQLHLSGWRDRGSGLLNSVVDELHAMRTKAFAAGGRKRPSIQETRFAVGMMHQTLALDPLFGEDFRRSAGISSADKPSIKQRKEMWGAMLRAILEG
ncbi:TetR/AcrR family transcriptional regulator [Parvibaculum sp.]|uniref:TetR/AcrR family transcriptional regulator n=1 Tax=Parvibaculum sp. TaxID=2024848 RepID=UPI0034A064A0